MRRTARRAGPAYGVAEGRARLLRLADLEERLATACAAWLWSTPGFWDTLELAAMAEDCAAAADALRARADELWPATATAEAVVETDDLAALADRAERSGDDPATREAAAAAVLTRLRDAYAAHLADTDELVDAPTARVLRPALASVEDRLGRLERGPALPARPGEAPRLTGEPARDGRFRVVPIEEYRVAHMGDTPNEIVRHLLYTNAYGELEAVEVLGRALAVGRGLPWPMRRALFRQLWDEARHAEMSWRRMEELGGPPVPLPPAPPVIMAVCGAIEDPLEQLLVLQRVVEGRVVERHRARVVRLVGDLDDPVTARLYEFIVADERTHVANSAWIPRLVGDDAERLAHLGRLQARCEVLLEDVLARRADSTAAPVGGRA